MTPNRRLAMAEWRRRCRTCRRQQLDGSGNLVSEVSRAGEATVILRHRDQMRSAFVPVAELLDAKLCECAVDEGTEVLDRSNRTGFEKSGFGQHSWHYSFVQRRPCGSYMAECTASVWFVEPLHEGALREVSLEWRSEVFAIGSPSWHSEHGRETVALADLPSLDLATATSRLLRLAQSRLPRSCREANV